MSNKTGRVESPCVRNCCLGEDDICVGCFRSLQEIIGWDGANDKEREAIVERARQRREAQQQKVGEYFRQPKP